MNPILQGSLRHFTVADVLTLLAQRMQSGTIDFENEGKRTRVVMRDGKIVGADSADAAAAVGAACYWTDGTFTLVHDVMVGDGVTPADYEVGALLEEIERRAAAEKEEAQRYNDNVTFRGIDNSEAQERLDPTADELKLLIRIGLGRKISDLIGNRDRKEFIKTLKRLEAGGVIERVDGEKSDEPWKSEAESPKKDAKPQQPAAVPPKAAEPKPVPPAAKPKAEPKPEPKPEPKASAQADARPEPKAEAKQEAKPDPKPDPAAKPKLSDDATQMLRPEQRRTAGRGLMASLTSDGGDAFPLLDDEAVIGRAATNTISLNDGSISTRHARITRTPDGFFIEDLKSRNGTFVNGDPVTERRPLADSDTIRLGKVIFTFNVATELTSGDTTAGLK